MYVLAVSFGDPELGHQGMTWGFNTEKEHLADLIRLAIERSDVVPDEIHTFESGDGEYFEASAVQECIDRHHIKV